MPSLSILTVGVSSLRRRLQSNLNDSDGDEEEEANNLSFSSVTAFIQRDLPTLLSVEFGQNVFSTAKRMTMTNLPVLANVTFGDFSFANGFVFEMENTGVEHLSIGSNCFNGEDGMSVQQNGRRLQSGLNSVMSLVNNHRLESVVIPYDSLNHVKELKMENMNNLESIVIGTFEESKNAPFQHAHSFIVNDLVSLREVTLGSKVCQECSVFSADSPLIQNVVVGDFCFQGKDFAPQQGVAALQFSMVNKAALQTTQLGVGSFSSFNQYRLSSKLFVE